MINTGCVANPFTPVIYFHRLNKWITVIKRHESLILWLWSLLECIANPKYTHCNNTYNNTRRIKYCTMTLDRLTRFLFLSFLSHCWLDIKKQVPWFFVFLQDCCSLEWDAAKDCHRWQGVYLYFWGERSTHSRSSQCPISPWIFCRPLHVGPHCSGVFISVCWNCPLVWDVL